MPLPGTIPGLARLARDKKSTQLRHHMPGEQLYRRQRLGKREIAEDELTDQIVAAGLSDLSPQLRGNLVGCPGNALADFGELIEGRRAGMGIDPIVLASQMREAIVPARIGASRERKCLRVAVGDHDEATEPHQRQRRLAPRLPPAGSKGIERSE